MSDHRDDPAAIRRAGVGLESGGKPGALVHPRSMAEVALNCAGFFVGLLIMTGDYVVARRSLNQENWEFLASPKAMVWIILVAGQFAFWATIVQPLWGRLSRLRLDYGLRRTREIRVKFAAAIIFFALPGFFLVRIVPDSNLAHHDLKMAIVNFTAMIVSLIAVMGIWYVRAALEGTFGWKGAGERPVHSVQEGMQVLLDLRGDLQWFITLLGAMVALAALAKGALRQAFLATGGNPAEFPSEYVAPPRRVFHWAAGPRLYPDVHDPCRHRCRPPRVCLSHHRARPGLGKPVPVAGEPQEPEGDPATGVRGGRQPAGQRLDPVTGRHERHHRPAGDEMTRRNGTNCVLISFRSS